MVKHLIRTRIRSQRKEQALPTKALKDKTIIARLKKLEIFRRAKTILIYAPIPHEKEINTWPLLRSKKTFVLPKTNTRTKTLSLYCVSKKSETLPSIAHKIPEPDSTQCKKITPQKIDLAIIPGIAFDHEKNRIGYGHGYYDRLLKKLRCPTIALAYEFQILHAVPRDPHDAPVDMIITEKRLIS